MHYMDGSGSDYWVNYAKAYDDDSQIRKLVDEEIDSAREWAERIANRTGRSSFSMTGDNTSARRAKHYPETGNWQKALGDRRIWGSAGVFVNGDQITMKITIHALDQYDFNKGAKDITSKISDNVNGRFATLGWAKPFTTRGGLEKTVSWTIGRPGGTFSPDGGVEHR
ncbi:hypothetical protein [Kitasatospora sp. NPDC097643]|uniref:hypothetical protein n=1 Tax=Kitasatospora sp. NPDC097643 TaxID=3157230 RepID=UPI003318F68E